MKELILVRGVPGSGKSTLAMMFGDFHVISADHYFEDGKGNYNFDASKIKDAHRMCRHRVEEMMKCERNIAVANTFTQEWEMEEYFAMAKEYDYQVHTIIVENRHGGKNVHGVPKKKVKEMRDRFQIKL